MPVYTCERCLEEFVKKDRYDSHLARKNPCKPTKAVKEIIEEKVKEQVRKTSNETIELNKTNQQSFFEDLHNLLWSRSGLTPEKALEHMTFFFAYRLIEIQADNLNLPQECRWAYLANMNNENDVFETMRKGCESFRKNKVTKPFFKPPQIEKASVVYDIVKLINRISLKSIQETDTLGNIFEYMLGRGMSTMSDEGQYFTNRKICNLAFKLAYSIKQNIYREDGSLCTFADWFCGTGGFASEYIKGVKNIDKNIDWNIHSKSIYCQDMSTSSIMTTLLNMLITTGVPFSDKTIRSGDSFTEPITIGENAPFKDIVVDYCFMNPPYGGDKTKGKEYKFVYSKGKGVDKKYLVNSEIQSIGIEDDDKVSAGVQLAMYTLAPKGVCCIVLPQGFFFGTSKKATELRKKITEEYKIHYIVEIPSGSFANTKTATSMLIFQKGVGPTTTLKFIGLDEQEILQIELTNLQNKNYTFNYKQYVSKETIQIDGFQFISLKDICEFKRGSMIIKANLEVGTVPVIGGGLSPMGYHNKSNRPANTILISQSGENAGSISRYNVPVWASDCFSIESKNKEILNDYYLYHILKTIEIDIRSLRNGTAQPHVYPSSIEHLKIAIPSLERQKQIVDAIDGWATLAQCEMETVNILEKQIMFYVKEISKGKPHVKLGDLCDINSGETFRKDDIIPGNIPVIGGGKIVGYHNVSNRPGNEFTITRVGDCNIKWFDDPFMLTEHGFSITLKEQYTNKCLLKVIFYHLQNVKEDIIQLYDGTAQKLTTKSKLRDFIIPLFDDSDLNTLKCELDEILHKHRKITYYNVKSQESIKRLIPGA